MFYAALILELDEVREHRTRRGGMQLLVDVGIHARHHRRNRVEAVPYRLQHLALALIAMLEIGGEEGLEIGARRAVRGIKRLVVARLELLYAGDVFRHVA